MNRQKYYSTSAVSINANVTIETVSFSHRRLTSKSGILLKKDTAVTFEGTSSSILSLRTWLDRSAVTLGISLTR